VNRAIGFETDMDQYHVEDYWVAPGVQPGARGDCEDYALEKRRQLINLGFPAAAMSLAIVSMPQEKTHAVLIVTTTDADYVLDNLSPSIKVWHDTKYPWIIRQGAADDLTWFSLYPTRLAH
jgi:predicted transglutaminase-like cysteine proteinase